MTLVDWVIVAFVLLLSLRGYERGFVVGALSLVGFAVGALIGSRVGPLVLSDGRCVAVRAAVRPRRGAAARQPGRSRVRARRVRGVRADPLDSGVQAARRPARGVADRLRSRSGSSGSPAPRWSSRSEATRCAADIEQSTILRALDSNLPPSGPILGALAKIDPLPSITGPPADVSPPTGAILAAPGVTRAIASVVRITGQACGVGIEGSGWVAAPDVVVTNAHVVAGETNTLVQRGGDRDRDCRTQLVLFDTHNDVAVLRVPG